MTKRITKTTTYKREKKKKFFASYAVAIRMIEISNAFLRPKVSPILPRRIPPIGRIRKAPPKTANASRVPSPLVVEIMEEEEEEGVTKEVALVMFELSFPLNWLLAMAVASIKNIFPKVDAKKP